MAGTLPLIIRFPVQGGSVQYHPNQDFERELGRLTENRVRFCKPPLLQFAGERIENGESRVVSTHSDIAEAIGIEAMANPACGVITYLPGLIRLIGAQDFRISEREADQLILTLNMLVHRNGKLENKVILLINIRPTTLQAYQVVSGIIDGTSGFYRSSDVSGRVIARNCKVICQNDSGAAAKALDFILGGQP